MTQGLIEILEKLAAAGIQIVPSEMTSHFILERDGFVAFVEGYNHATGQWIGRTTQNRTLNFVHPQHAGPSEGATLTGTSWSVRVTRAGPNSLAGEVVI